MKQLRDLYVTTTNGERHFTICEINDWTPNAYEPLIVHWIERVNAVAPAVARTTIFMPQKIVSITYDKE